MLKAPWYRDDDLVFTMYAAQKTREQELDEIPDMEDLSPEDIEYIKKEVKRMYEEGILKR